MLDADREANVAGRYTAGQLIIWAQLRVCGAGRHGHGQRACDIADVGHVIEELQRIDETRSSLAAMLELRADETAIAPEILVGAAALLGIFV